MTIAGRIIATVPLVGCKVRTLRAVLHDIEAAPLDYAIQGLLNAGRFVISDGFIRPVRNLQPISNPRGLKPAPYHGWNTLEAQLRELLKGMP